MKYIGCLNLTIYLNYEQFLFDFRRLYPKYKELSSECEWELLWDEVLEMLSSALPDQFIELKARQSITKSEALMQPEDLYESWDIIVHGHTLDIIQVLEKLKNHGYTFNKAIMYKSFIKYTDKYGNVIHHIIE